MTFKHFFKMAVIPIAICQAFAAHAELPAADAQTPQEKASWITSFINDDNPFRMDFTMGDHPSYIQLYGIVDISRQRINHSLPVNYELPNNFYPYSGAKISPSTQSRTDWVNSGLQASRVGLKGEFDGFKMGDQHFKWMYQFETGFNPLDMKLHDAAQTLADNSGTNANSSVNSNSSLNGQWFARQAWVGLDGGSLGRVSYGTQYNPFYEITAAYDPNGKADSFSPLGESGTIGGGGGISENTRMHNALKYGNTYNIDGWGKVNYAGMYQFGNAAGTSDGHGYTMQLGFENAQFGIQLAYDRFDDAIKTGVAAPGNPLANDTIAVALYNTDATLLTAKWMPTIDLKLMAGWEWYQLKPSSSDAINYNHVFDQTVFGGVAKSALKPGFKQDNNVYYVGGVYDFAQSFPVLAGLSTSLGFYKTKFDAIDGPTVSNNSEGTIDTWTWIADYRFNKRFDAYLAYTNNQFSGDKYPKTSFYQDVNSAGAGLRLKF